LVLVAVQVLKQRMAQLEATMQQAELLRQENSLLRQQLGELDSAVRSCRQQPRYRWHQQTHHCHHQQQQQQQQQVHRCKDGTVLLGRASANCLLR
jgi:DNA primase